ncbi:FliI/YscN family ATPase [Priestia filamentosa]|uniref:FliI/YscN family ATPase n=1 Tax=Priestia filamentosa TaxID=1402861 RepID=UPI00397C67C3
MINFQSENKICNYVFSSSPIFLRRGKIHTIKEQYYISKGPKAKIGDICLVGEGKIMCEVISVNKENNILLPFNTGEKIENGDFVELISDTVLVPKLKSILGKVLNANGKVINGEDDCPKEEVSLDSPPINAFERQEINETMPTGVKAIDTMTTIGVGQKIGIFAGSGVGKSTLLGMVAKNAKADVIVIGLVGERGREVKDFIRKELGEEGLKRSVLVVATSDESRLMQLRCAKLATSIAEKFRDEGNNVLLMMDSVTRFADARRDLDIATQDFPVGGKTLSMGDYMKKLLERSGKTSKGSITGIYTVLVDGDDENGPVPDLARGILDGHIVLSRELATAAHYPAISVLSSVSRIMEDIVTKEHWSIANKIRYLLSLYRDNETYFKLGTIQESTENAHIFEAKNKVELINKLLVQDRHDNVKLEDSVKMFGEVI